MARKTAKKTPAKKKPGTAVAVHRQQQQPAPTSFLEFLHRASINPHIDAAKVREFLNMKREEDARAAEAQYDISMAAAQMEMEPIRKDLENKQTRSQYASLPKLDAAIRPIYLRHGFNVTFGTDECPLPDHMRITIRVAAHGHRYKTFIDIPADGKGPQGAAVMTRTHAAGSAVTYGRKNLLCMAFNLITVDKLAPDDDGNAAGKVRDATFINADQVKEMTDYAAKHGIPHTRILAYVATVARTEPPTIEEIPAALFERTMNKMKKADRQ